MKRLILIVLVATGFGLSLHFGANAVNEAGGGEKVKEAIVETITWKK